MCVLGWVNLQIGRSISSDFFARTANTSWPSCLMPCQCSSLATKQSTDVKTDDVGCLRRRALADVARLDAPRFLGRSRRNWRHNWLLSHARRFSIPAPRRRFLAKNVRAASTHGRCRAPGPVRCAWRCRIRVRHRRNGGILQCFRGRQEMPQ